MHLITFQLMLAGKTLFSVVPVQVQLHKPKYLLSLIH